MKLVDFNNCKLSRNAYGGHSGQKLGIIYNDEEYMLKFPGNLRERNMKNINLSYSNSPVCEYIGSKIYESLEIPVHETLLGTRNGKTVVACKDFTQYGSKLLLLSELKVTMEPEFIRSDGHASDGTSGNLNEILETIDKHPLLQNIEGVKDFFWDMFVVDSFIGNNDRNNENWGILVDKNDEKLAPVYDNGNALNSKWDDERMRKVLGNQGDIIAEAYNARRCFHEINDKRINPYHFISSMEIPELNEAVKRIVPRIDMDYIRDMIVDLKESGIISEVQCDFFNKILQVRYEHILEPTLEKLIEREQTLFDKLMAGKLDNKMNYFSQSKQYDYEDR